MLKLNAILVGGENWLQRINFFLTKLTLAVKEGGHQGEGKFTNVNVNKVGMKPVHNSAKRFFYKLDCCATTKIEFFCSVIQFTCFYKTRFTLG